MKIGILQTGRSPDEAQAEHGDYDGFFVKYLAGRGFEFETYAALDGQLPQQPEDAEGWLITGSRFGSYEPHAWIPPLEAFLRRVFAAKIPIFGVCFGHQILAQALGGKVEKFAGGWSVGPETYDSDLLGAQTMIAWHQDQVVKRPQDARVVGRSAFCENAILAYGNQALTIQPHPEFSAEFYQSLLAYRGHVLPDDIKAKAQRDFTQDLNRDLNRDLTSPDFAEVVENFFKRKGPFAADT